jgi:hypothetical protein
MNRVKLVANKESAYSRGAIDIMEEVFHLLRRAPLRILASYCVGTLPFLLGLLYFWTDMSRSAFAYYHVVQGSFVLSLLFVWMKCWHVLYARQLLAEVGAERLQRWTPAQVFRTAVRQTIVQSSGLFLLPLSLLMTVPFPWVYAFYQNATVLEDGRSTEIMSLVKKAREFALPWQKQNLFMIWALSPFLMIVAAFFFLIISPIVTALTADVAQIFLRFYMGILYLCLLPLSPFGMIVGANIALFLFQVPYLFETLTGMQTSFTLQMGGMFNTTFFATVCGLTFLCMDPLMKAAYVLRCFYIGSQQTGEDLRASLRQAGGKFLAPVIVLLIFLAAWLAAPREVLAQQTSVNALSEGLSISSAELDRALDAELQQPQYAWRMPRILPVKKESGLAFSFMRDIANMLADWGETILRWTDPIRRMIKALLDQLREKMPEFRGRRNLEEISFTLRIIMYSLVVLLIGAGCFFVWRTWKNCARRSLVVMAELIKAIPDIEKETTTAADLPEDGWIALAKELLDKGELRLALRAVFLASLAFLGRAGFIYIALFKSNRDYMRELERRAHAHPGLLDIFSRNSSVYEAVWYGNDEPCREMIDYLLINQKKLQVYEVHE